MKKFSLIISLLFLAGCTGIQKKQPQKKELTRDEIIDAKLKQVLAIAETSLEISKKSESMSKQALEKSNQANATSEKALNAANKAIDAANEARKFAEEETQKAIEAANKSSKMAIEYADRVSKDAIDAANEAIKVANKSSEKSISVANQTIAEVNRLRATIKMKPEEEPIIMKEPEIKKTYVIKKGDTLSKIAKKFYGDANKWKKIYERNKKIIKNSNFLIPGTEIVIP